MNITTVEKIIVLVAIVLGAGVGLFAIAVALVAAGLTYGIIPND